MRSPSEAIPSYERAAELDPTAPDFRLKLAQAHLATGDTVRAGDVLRRLLDMVPDEPRARRALAMLGLSR
jgi:cytochrome c-type biogenesis protein CcmH/NrfG